MSDIDKNYFGLKHFVSQLGFYTSNLEIKYLNCIRPKTPTWKAPGTNFIESWEVVKEEFIVKFKKSFTRKHPNNSIISASDLSSYTFCPASFAISKAFKIEPNVKASTGSSFHNENRLLSYGLTKGSKVLINGKLAPSKNYDDVTIREKERVELWQELNRSTVVFLGHSEEGKKEYFFDKKRIFVSQPDYIFLNDVGKKYVVEEKFIMETPQSNEFERAFYINHKIQLASYLYGINEHYFEHGYLLYWIYKPKYRLGFSGKFNVYDIYDGMEISHAYVLRIDKNDRWKHLLNTTFSKVNRLLKTGVEPFDVSRLNPSKCANCAVSSHCGHKTGRFADLELAYPDRYLELQSSSVPKEYLGTDPRVF